MAADDDDRLYLEQAVCLKDLHAVVEAMLNLKKLESRMAAEKAELCSTLVDQFGWSQGDVAKELGVTSQMVCKLLRRKRVNAERDA